MDAGGPIFIGGTGRSAKPAPDMVRLVETELGEWMRAYGYLS